MSVLLEFSMTPLDKGESVSKYVSRSLDIIDQSGLPFSLNPMGTVIEGQWEEVMKVVKDCYDKMNSDCSRISCMIKIDARKGKDGRIKSKIQKIETILNKDLNK
ncbi:MAG: MTH1187 family thiamine-binding protein [Deltaproteobacteria bacterium]|nr:MTH1187 family thiamine-binding protein [Deltaproteobacteria bacterium]